jgi:hypothetical protein
MSVLDRLSPGEIKALLWGVLLVVFAVGVAWAEAFQKRGR